MKITFNKQLHGNRTIRFIDIIVDNGMDNDYSCTMIYIPTMREYVTLDYKRGIDTNIIVGIRYVANSYIGLASTCTLDFSNDIDSDYYHFTSDSNCHYNFVQDSIPCNYMQFVNSIIHIMTIYS